MVMKKTIACHKVLFCSLLVLLLSCSKNSKDSFSRSTVAANKVIDVKVTSGGTYSLNIGPSGNVSITKQAAHYLISETGTGENGSLVYKYIPAAGFKGTDEVSLLHTIETVDYSSNGCNYGSSMQMNRVASSILVKLTVGD